MNIYSVISLFTFSLTHSVFYFLCSLFMSFIHSFIHFLMWSWSMKRTGWLRKKYWPSKDLLWQCRDQYSYPRDAFQQGVGGHLRALCKWTSVHLLLADRSQRPWSHQHAVQLHEQRTKGTIRLWGFVSGTALIKVHCGLNQGALNAHQEAFVWYRIKPTLPEEQTSNPIFSM